MSNFFTNAEGITFNLDRVISINWKLNQTTKYDTINTKVLVTLPEKVSLLLDWVDDYYTIVQLARSTEVNLKRANKRDFEAAKAILNIND